ncbi:uncharacterized protein B0I36DRAFT_364639 [Microdochium trichocladiopsis]|uniref:Pal1 cell morphology protein-domain-containing protein n=1 Tax=Microdochium trichocladiopsis TaxID=1682393 RepID=A0A9P8Y1L3_9PEZI|nr:uncharacterized protein B0I36DRAFT_364639 [Microdochium trichocladiopsis]KAH7027436.1 hypothetical protein B0I36DRAFT_364639 [Microdochium trichocladiopsis]
MSTTQTMAPARPLEQIKRETKAANRAPHLRKQNFTGTDQIDMLDDVGIGGAYHHDGPYDATLASRNRDKRYAPVEAVKETNMAALRATPRERIQDSLKHHVPLSGTAEVPPGMTDRFGRVLDFEEGDDLMRDSDAPGGPYARYEHVPYHPEDLKGKGEPSFTIERDRKARKHAKSKSMGSANGTNVYEMQPQAGRASASGREQHPGEVGRGAKNGTTPITRQRSSSSGAFPSNSRSSPLGASGSGDLSRRASTSKRLSGGLKRTFGSLRRRHHAE